MKKIYICVLLAALLSSSASGFAYAADATINTSNASKGIIGVTCTGDMSKGIVIQVVKGSDKYQYQMKKSSVNVPMQMGTGKYTITVFEMVSGNQAKPITSSTVDASSIDEKSMFSTSVVMVDFGSSTKAIPAYKTVAGTGGENDKANNIYESVVNGYSYDNDKAANPPKNYVPVIDDVYTAKKGICYDYSAVFGGSLRSNGIPAKLVMGYAPEIAEYHAWNEIMLDGKWVVVDTTYDSAMARGGQKYTMAKNSKQFKVVKVY